MRFNSYRQSAISALSLRLVIGAAALLCLRCCISCGADQPQWGERFTRNQISSETGLPSAFDIKTGENIKWSAELGTNTFTTPIVSGGKVLIGTNNGNPRNEDHLGDRGILMCFNEQDGAFLWQLAIPKITDYQDWPNIGLTSVPTVEGDRIYLITNRCEVMCLDLEGQANGNQGPYMSEGLYLAADEQAAAGPQDADILWVTDLISELGVHPHDSPHGSILVKDRFLYLCTSNGIDATHNFIPALEAPGMAVLDKETGKIVAEDGQRMGPGTAHCTWSSPSCGEDHGRELVLFGGGDGILYGFAPWADANGDAIGKLSTVWKFDCDPDAPKENVQQYRANLKVSASNITGMPVFKEGRIYLAMGGDLWWGKKHTWLKCIDASLEGDVTRSAEIWSYPLEEHCMSTPAVSDGLAFIGDCGRHVHCVDIQTGKGCWKHYAEGEIWGSPLLADGKVYIGTLKGDLWIFEASRELKVLNRINLRSPIHATPTAANGVLYIAVMDRLYAIAAGQK